MGYPVAKSDRPPLWIWIQQQAFAASYLADLFNISISIYVFFWRFWVY
jgi:hypothetical protein